MKIGTNYPPVVYFLLPDKKGPTYACCLWRILSEMAPDVQPAKMLLDFEIQAMDTFGRQFPGVSLTGCHFHFSRSIIRKVSELGLKRLFETNPDFAVSIKMFIALAFVPEGDVEDRLGELMDDFPAGQQFDDFLFYFTHTYVVGPTVGNRRRPPKFRIQLRNHFNDAIALAPKTTNCCEGFHNSLHSLFLPPHPTVWTLLGGLKRDIAIHRLTAQNALGGNPERPRAKYQKLAKRLQDTVGKYHESHDKKKYLRAVAHLQ